MPKGLFIIGTDTEVGKTVVSAGLIYLLLKKQYTAAYFKPVASGEVRVGNIAGSADACFVKKASGFAEQESNITPFAFKNAVAPHLASRMENKPIDIAVIKDRLQYLKERYEWILAEGAGGLAVPLNDNGYMQFDLIRELGFSCLLVSRAGLGTINHTLLTLRFAESLGIKIKGIVLNGFTGSVIEKDNIETLGKLIHSARIFIIPAVDGIDTEKLLVGNLRDVFEKTIDIEDVLGLMDSID